MVNSAGGCSREAIFLGPSVDSRQVVEFAVNINLIGGPHGTR
jgi:hypothetical protein